MNENLVELFNTIVTEPELLEKFNGKNNLQDLYEFSTSIVSGYTIDEFKNFLADIVETCSQQHNIQEVSPNDLEYVAGGLNAFGSRKIQSLLLGGALMSLGNIPAYAISDNNLNNSYNNGVSISQNKSYENNKYKRSFSNVKNNDSKTQNENTDIADKNANNANSNNAYNRISNKNDINAKNRFNDNESNNNTNISNKNAKNNRNSSNNDNGNNNISNKNAKNNENRYNNNNSNNKTNDAKKNADNANNTADKNAKNNANNNNGNIADKNNKNSENRNNNNNNHNNVTNKNTENKPFLHVDTSIIMEPKSTTITYGQKLYESSLSGGVANVPGRFEWTSPYAEPTAGSHTFWVQFTPNDGSLPPKTIPIKVKVEKAAPEIIRKPKATTITYGQSLRSSSLFRGESDVNGSFAWKNDRIFLNAGSHDEEVLFTPSDSKNYKQITVRVRVQVDKATPRLEKNSFTREYKANGVLNDIYLPKGWKWENPYMHLDGIGKFEVRAIHDETFNYHYRSETIFIEITKTDPTIPSFDIVYNPYSTLHNVRLPAGWHWENPDEIPQTSKRTYKASFDANDAGTPYYYSKYSVDIPVNVSQATPRVFSWAHQASEIVYGSDLSAMPMLGGSADVPGTFRFADTPSPLPAGHHICKVVFTPFDYNYQRVEGYIPVQIAKNMTPMYPPNFDKREIIRKDTSVDLSRLSQGGEIEFSKDGGMTWSSSPVFNNLSPNTRYYFVGRYKETNSRCAGYTSETLSVLTKSSAPAAPNAPVLKSRTNKKIVLESNDKLEFSIDGGKHWQSSPEFKGLKRKTNYSVTARFKETDDFVPSKESETISVTTNRFPRPFSWIFG